MVPKQDQVAELWAVVSSRDVPAVLATRVQIVCWMAERRMRKDVTELAGMSPHTVDGWMDRHTQFGLAGLEDHKRGGGRGAGPGSDPGPDPGADPDVAPLETGLSH